MDEVPPPLVIAPVSPPPVHPARGWLLVIVGTGLSVAMAFLSYALHDVIQHQSEPGSRSHWRGAAEFTRTVFELFGTVFVFGLVAVAAGIYILRKRRISRIFAAMMILLGLGMGYLGYVIIQTNVPR